MRYIISLFWSFIFSAVIVFVVSSILGSNGEINTIRDCAILAVLFTIFAALFDVVGIDKKREEK